jgi:F0F1-type ATP synthase assembly protein I
LKLFPQKRINTDDAVGKGMDLALSMLLFLGLGYLLDRWLGTRPLFMIVLVALIFVGQMVRFWYEYEAKMKAHEAERAAKVARR